jgi:O-acetyl-ADP-ribose deacetylase (regulator of RNase III)
MEVVKGNLFDYSYKQGFAIGHGCNVDGAMGAGIAKSFRAMFPDMYLMYRVLCESGRAPVGDFQSWSYWNHYEPGPVFWGYNLFTQDRPGPCARIEWIDSSIALAVEDAERQGVKLAIPEIGCGIGGLNPREVYAVFEQHDIIVVQLPS